MSYLRSRERRARVGLTRLRKLAAAEVSRRQYGESLCRQAHILWIEQRRSTVQEFVALSLGIKNPWGMSEASALTNEIAKMCDAVSCSSWNAQERFSDRGRVVGMTLVFHFPMREKMTCEMLADQLRTVLKEGITVDADEEPSRPMTLLEYLKTVDESPLTPRAWWHIAIMNDDAPLRFTSWFTTTFRSSTLVAAQRASLDDASSLERRALRNALVDEEQTNPFEFWDVLAFMWAKAKL